VKRMAGALSVVLFVTAISFSSVRFSSW
jgi:hypothetical protein